METIVEKIFEIFIKIVINILEYGAFIFAIMLISYPFFYISEIKDKLNRILYIIFIIPLYIYIIYISCLVECSDIFCKKTMFIWNANYRYFKENKQWYCSKHY